MFKYISTNKHLVCDKLFYISLLFFTFISVLTTIIIFFVLGSETFSFFSEVSIIDFFFGTKWSPIIEPRSFGVIPLICGTLIIVLGSSMIAIPIGTLTAIYLSEFASSRIRNILKPFLEILAGIPTIVYGYFALTFVTPLLSNFFPSIQVFNALSAAIVVGIMILPIVCSLCDDAIRSFPIDIKEAGYSVGATNFEVILNQVLYGTKSSIIASYIIAISRAIGETMAVTLAAGATAKVTLNPFESIQTMTAYIVQASLGDMPAQDISYKTCFAVGACLFLVTFLMNTFVHYIMKGKRKCL